MWLTVPLLCFPGEKKSSVLHLVSPVDVCPVWVTAQQRQRAWNGVCAEERLPELTGTSFWQTLLKEPFQVKCLHHGTENKLSLTQRGLTTILSRNCDCRNKLGKGKLQQGTNQHPSSPAARSATLRGQPFMVWSARGIVHLNFSIA